MKVRRDPEGNRRSHGGVAERDEAAADAINLWGTILHCGEIFSSNPKSNPGIGGEYLE